MMKPILTVTCLALAGCAAVGPDYTQPELALPQTFVGGTGTGAATADLATHSWWADYRDPTLTALVTRGLTQSLSVQQAEQAIRQAQAQLRQTGVNSALSGTGTASRLRSGGTGLAAGTATESGLDAGIVLDLFGGLRREREGAAANLAAAQADVEVARLAWLSSLIAAYADARYYQQAMALTRQTISTREGTLEITQRQADAGGATSYEVAQARASLESARADMPGYLAQFNANVFAMAALLNEPAAPLLAQMQKGAAPLRTPKSPATGVPADLLRTRPDVRYSEAVLRQQVAEVGVDTAALLPSVSLTGAIGDSAGKSSWSFGPSLSLPVLNQGKLRAARAAQISAARQAELDWRATVSDAVEDVQTAGSNLTQYRLQSAALDRAARSYGEALDLARGNYEAGAITLLDLLDTDRSEASARISAASAANNAAKECAVLQIALGVGARPQ